jgi:hypothetical protein
MVNGGNPVRRDSDIEVGLVGESSLGVAQRHVAIENPKDDKGAVKILRIARIEPGGQGGGSGGISHQPLLLQNGPHVFLAQHEQDELRCGEEPRRGGRRNCCVRGAAPNRIRVAAEIVSHSSTT